MNTVPRQLGEVGVRTGISDRTRNLLFFLLLALVGALAVLYPEATISILAIVVILALTFWALNLMSRSGLELWQGLLIFTLSCDLILNYGFDNIAIHMGSLPLVVSYALRYTCLALALYKSRSLLVSALKEPVMVCILILIFLSSLHFIFDVPAFGVWAIRDSTLFLDGVFFLLGFFWAAADTHLRVWLRWMMAVCIINLLYAYTFPWSEKILNVSPTSGVFMPVPIFGQYHSTSMVLVMGTVFCMGLARFVMNKCRWILHGLVALQVLGLTILQMRATYIALAACLVVFILLREGRKAMTLLTLASLAVVGVFLLGAFGIELSGRIGPVNLAFLEDHLRSIVGVKVTAASTVESRFDFVDDTMKHIRAHPIVGEGFGRPLVDYIDEETGAVVRIPHNSSLTIMARLGSVGFLVWLAFNACVMARFMYAYRHRRSWNPLFREFALWSFLYYLSFIIVSLVEGPLEQPAIAVPFYFLVGLAVAVIRLRMAEDRRTIPAVSASSAL
jgi:O-antigen ligase